MEIRAKTVVDDKFWIIEQGGEKVATLQKKENNKFILSNTLGEVMFNKKEELIRQFGKEFFLTNKKIKIVKAIHENECYDYPTSRPPFNSMYDVRRKLPLFTKSLQSKSLYCAGYYIIKFNKGWVKSFCPKVSTIEHYPYRGPFKNKAEIKMELLNAKSN